jgi:hypothetical protein
VIKAENTIHTYHQVASYIEKYQPLAVEPLSVRLWPTRPSRRAPHTPQDEDVPRGSG